MTTRRPGSFIATREHRRFIEFADAVRRHATIGLCHGPAGVGKTLSARRYAHWDLAEPLLTDWGPRATSDEKVYAALARSRTLFYTPVVAGAMATMRKDISLLINRVSACIEQGLSGPGRNAAPIGRLELIIIDEAERLTTTTLEYLRDQFDRSDTGLILIGMPGIERRMARYPQLYSRIGFSHRYAPLSKDELAFVLKRHWQHRGQEMSDELHGRPSHGRDRPPHWWKLPPPSAPLRPGRPRPAHQRALGRHRRGRRSRRIRPRHRTRHLAIKKVRHITIKVTLQRTR